MIHAMRIRPFSQTVDIVRVGSLPEEKAVYCWPNGDRLYCSNKLGEPSFAVNGRLFRGEALILHSSGTAPHTPIVELIRSVDFLWPGFGVETVMEALMDGRFHVMTEHDQEAFLDAPPGSLFNYDLNGYLVIISPGQNGAEESLSIHAYVSPCPSGSQDRAYLMEKGIWTPL